MSLTLKFRLFPLISGFRVRVRKTKVPNRRISRLATPRGHNPNKKKEKIALRRLAVSSRASRREAGKKSPLKKQQQAHVRRRQLRGTGRRRTRPALRCFSDLDTRVIISRVGRSPRASSRRASRPPPRSRRARFWSSTTARAPLGCEMPTGARTPRPPVSTRRCASFARGTSSR